MTRQRHGKAMTGEKRRVWRRGDGDIRSGTHSCACSSYRHSVRAPAMGQMSGTQTSVKEWMPGASRTRACAQTPTAQGPRTSTMKSTSSWSTWLTCGRDCSMEAWTACTGACMLDLGEGAGASLVCLAVKQ
eukprot:274242-Chlamydomonas_euryale.AAC.1